MPEAVWINPPSEKTTRQDAPGATISTPDDLEHPPTCVTYGLSASPAILAGQVIYAHTGAFPELLSIYHLLGDPALKLR